MEIFSKQFIPPSHQNTAIIFGIGNQWIPSEITQHNSINQIAIIYKSFVVQLS